MREATGYTPNSLAQMLRERGTDLTSRDVGLGAIDLHLDDPDGAHMVIQGNDIRATDGGIEALGAFLQVPVPFIKRLRTTAGLKPTQDLLEALMQAAPQSA